MSYTMGELAEKVNEVIRRDRKEKKKYVRHKLSSAAFVRAIEEILAQDEDVQQFLAQHHVRLHLIHGTSCAAIRFIRIRFIPEETSPLYTFSEHSSTAYFCNVTAYEDFMASNAFWLSPTHEEITVLEVIEKGYEAWLKELREKIVAINTLISTMRKNNISPTLLRTLVHQANDVRHLYALSYEEDEENRKRSIFDPDLQEEILVPAAKELGMTLDTIADN